MPRNLFTTEEVTLCTYIARFGKIQFNETKIHKLTNRSIDSIKMKVYNIACMLDEEGFKSKTPKLTGLPTGQKGRRTNWNVVSKLTGLNQNEFYNICQDLLK